MGKKTKVIINEITENLIMHYQIENHLAIFNTL